MPASTSTAGAPRLLVPVRLPERLDGTRLEHLSASSLARFWRCPESWRAHYLARVRGPESPGLRRGWAVDAAIDAHYRAILDTGEPLPRRDIEDLYAAAWQRRLEDAAAIDWGDEPPDDVRDAGLVALRAYLDELAPAVRPVSVQREFRFALAPELEWTLTGRLDLEDADGAVIDIKVKKRHVAQTDADSDPQPSLYLLERALAGRPAPRFLYHSLTPAAKAKTKVVATRRSRDQLEAFAARILATARAIDGLHRTFGPQGPWPLTDPTHWCCSQRFCAAWTHCPGGAGLAAAAA
jgi:PD-(D/E)XK nuclease superfamily